MISTGNSGMLRHHRRFCLRGVLILFCHHNIATCEASADMRLWTPLILFSLVAARSLESQDTGSNITTKASHHCENIHEAEDPCAYALKYCSPASAGMVDYIGWYYCSMSTAQPLAFGILVSWTAMLFSTIGIASSDFFCPNLATIANSLGMSQSVAGVTLLAFGNGSPDVFSTFAAFKAHSGSLAIGELLGAAAFITSVVAGSMAIIAPFKVSKRSFLRDAGFFLIAVLMTMVLLADGRLRLWESVLMIVFYASYVLYVLIGTYYHSKDNRKKIINSRIRSQYAVVGSETVVDIPDAEFDEDASRLLSEDQDIAALEEGGHDSEEEHDFQDLNSSMSVTGRPMHTSQTSVRPSILGALEFRSLVTTMAEGEINPQTVNSMKRRVRSHSTFSRTLSSRSKAVSPEIAFIHQHNHIHPRRSSQPVQMPRHNSAPDSEIASSSLRKTNPIELLAPLTLEQPALSESDPFARTFAQSPPRATNYNSTTLPEEKEHWWPSILPAPWDLKTLLLPTLTDFSKQSHTQRLVSILAVPSVLVLTLTLPVVNPPVNKTIATSAPPSA